jgi:hypothetical protein
MLQCLSLVNGLTKRQIHIHFYANTLHPVFESVSDFR